MYNVLILKDLFTHVYVFIYKKHEDTQSLQHITRSEVGTHTTQQCTKLYSFIQLVLVAVVSGCVCNATCVECVSFMLYCKYH